VAQHLQDVLVLGRRAGEHLLPAQRRRDRAEVVIIRG
jgi:hypothetical protein